MFIETHILQNFAPSNLNRDDTNAPKDCMFGGQRRARISSQCMKRAIRTSPVFAAGVQEGTGQRTRLLVAQICDRVTPPGVDEEEVAKVAAFALEQAGFKMETQDKKKAPPLKERRTQVLLYLSPSEIDRYAEVIREHFEVLQEQANAKKGAAPKDVKKALASFGSTTESADIALFGRMVAENKNMNIDGATQVAHAMSTHTVSVEQDFFTAVDDLKPASDDSGAAMMGTVEFNSACYYRYSLVDLGQLTKNLGGDAEQARQVVRAFLQAQVAAIPTGKQSSMAAQNLPHFVGVRIRKDGMPMSLANAFEKPVWVGGTGKSLSEKSRHELTSFEQEMAAMYGDNGLVFSGDVYRGSEGDSLKTMFDKATEALA